MLGYRLEGSVIRRDLYRLLCAFMALEPVRNLVTAGKDDSLGKRLGRRWSKSLNTCASPRKISRTRSHERLACRHSFFGGPALLAAAGDRAAYRFLEFFTAQVRNPNTGITAYLKNGGTLEKAAANHASQQPDDAVVR